MKNVGKMLVAFWIGAMVWLVPTWAMAQKDVLDMEQFSPKQMEMMWDQFGKDQGWAAINKDVASKKFQRIKHEKASWGFKGKLKNAKGQMEDVMFCAFDFSNPNSKVGQGCSMIWRKVGDEVYKAYLIFPEGEKDMAKALEGSIEWFADEKGNIQKANSWGKCFRKCVAGNNRVVVDVKGNRFEVPANCGTGCLGSIAVCGGVSAVLAVASGGTGFVPLAVFFGICAGASCGVCIGGCALGCL
jgi:hypothetical protein